MMTVQNLLYIFHLENKEFSKLHSFFSYFWKLKQNNMTRKRLIEIWAENMICQ